MANMEETAPRAGSGANAGAVGGRSSSSSASAAAAIKAGPVLPWMRVPITIESGTGVPIEGVLGMDKRLVPALLNEFKFQELFPVQAAVWQHSAGGRSTAHDLCVAAPTGSGKTLAYALPVVNALADTTLQKHSWSLGRLQALVVLPTRDLAAQVYDVFRPLCEAVGLRAVLAAARSSEAAEAAQLLGTAAGGGGGGGPRRHQHLHQPAPGGMAGTAHGGGGSIGSGSGAGGGGGGGGGADVVVATPGRLMAHLSGTPGFTLEHLRFLVVDETDRLLRQSYQEWLPRVLTQLSPQHAALQQHLHVLAQAGYDIAGSSIGGSSGSNSSSSSHGSSGGGGHFAALWPGASTGTALPFTVPRVVKIVVSATLTRDPAKLQRLALHYPRYVATAGSAGAARGGGHGAGAGAGSAAAAAAAAGRYSLPRSLSEYRLLCSAARKPLALLVLLADASAAGESVIVFTSSLEMTHKLHLMLSAVPDLAGQVVEYSSHVPAKERAAGLERFRKGDAKVLVASDAMTRGMDVDCVQAVINYDAPVYAKTYVHRAGRTARAGKSGRVVTLLRDEDMRHFKAMIRKADNNFVRELKLPAERVESFRPALAGALQQLEALLAAEKRADAVTAAELLKQQQSHLQQQQQRQEQKHKEAGEARAEAEAHAEVRVKRQAEGAMDEEEVGADEEDGAEGEAGRRKRTRKAEAGEDEDAAAPARKKKGGAHKREVGVEEAGEEGAAEEGGKEQREGKRKKRRHGHDEGEE